MATLATDSINRRKAETQSQFKRCFVIITENLFVVYQKVLQININ